MGAQLGGSGMMADINMTPLIDIVLVVLIIMMVNIPIEVERMGVKLPAEVEKPVTPPPDAPEQLVIMLYEDGKIALNRELMDEDAIFGEVTRRLRSSEKKIVFVDAHPERSWNDVMDLVDVAKEAGAEKVSFARMKEDGPLAPTGVASGALPKGVYPGSPKTAGFMTTKKADEQFRPLLPTLSACWDEVLTRLPGAKGRLVLQVDVGPQGEIMASSVMESSVEDEAFEACVLERIPGLRYEALGYDDEGVGRTARINYPFLLSSG